nr:uncharacterized protein LOC109168299 [Ipomoea batatas]
MYTRIRNGLLTEEFLAGLDTFIQFATSQHSWMDGERIKCPCNQRKCQNTKFLDVATVKFHLAKYGFVSDYYVWRFHGECNLRVDVDQDVGAPSQMASEEESNAYHTMVMDAAGPEFNVDEIEESPNPEAQRFYDMLKAADQELWPGSKKHSQLSLVARLMSLKSENHISEKCFNQFTELMKEVAPEDNLVPENFYETKKLLRGMGNLKFPDGYASNMSRCVDMKKLKLFRMKSHDCHVFMQRVEEMTKLENDIPLILCKLERIFPPSFFDSMEHLPIHLAYEARIAGPVQYRWMYPLRGYYVNGFKFHTIGYGGIKETMNSGVCIKGINYSIDESDYYGRLVEVVQVEYPGLPVKRTILFKCEWFDPTTVGMKVHSQYKLVEVNHKRRFNRYEPFVLAMQAAQVYYCTYPSLRRDNLDWWAVCKIKARSEVEVPESSISSEESLIPPPFQEEITDNHDLMQIDEDPSHLNDPNGGVIQLDGKHGDNEDELELEEETDDKSRGSRDELQKEPNLFECFEHMHKKKNGAFVDERSKKIAEEIQARHDAATQEVEGSIEPPVINMSQLYVDVVGGVKKQRIYGLGTKASSFINSNSCSSSATSQFHQDTMKEMLDTM